MGLYHLIIKSEEPIEKDFACKDDVRDIIKEHMGVPYRVYYQDCLYEAGLLEYDSLEDLANLSHRERREHV